MMHLHLFVMTCLSRGRVIAGHDHADYPRYSGCEDHGKFQMVNQKGQQPNEGQHRARLDVSINLGFEAVMQQQLDQIFLFEVSHDWYLQEEEDIAQLLAYASEDVAT